MTDLKCMSFFGKNSSEILVAGCQNVMYKIDVDKGVIVQEVRLPASYQSTYSQGERSLHNTSGT